MSAFIRAASVLVWPEQPIESEPPLVSVRTVEKSAPVSIFTDDTCARWVVSSSRPIRRGVYCATLDGEISACVGKSRFPRLHRLARKT